jgi:nicotinamide-nucleotide amidase
MLTNQPGSSKYFLGGMISYSNDVKASLLNIKQSVLEQHGAVSREVACLMARGAREKTGSDIALSITGVAGPDGGTENKPVGTFFIGFSNANGTAGFHYLFASDRRSIRKYAAFTALDNLRRHLSGLPFIPEVKA